MTRLGLALPVPEVVLPIGISFFTFQGLSYLVDVYRRDVPAERSLVGLALYISLFPQLIAGPIVRYKDVAAEISQRRETVDEAAEGFSRFLAGLGKKVLLSNAMAQIADAAFIAPAANGSLSAALAGEDIPFVDMTRRFDDLGRPDDFYLPTDHHYSFLGALETYQTLMARVNADTGWDLPVTAQEDLELVDLPNPFLGSQNRKLYGLWPAAEHIRVGHLKTPIPFTRWDNGQEVEPSVYAIPADPGERVSYSVYMGADVAETIIRTDRPDLPSCLIWGDSFTNALETVLWTSFDETRSLDLRHYTAKTLSEYIAEYQPDVIICLRDDTAYTDLTGNGNIS